MSVRQAPFAITDTKALRPTRSDWLYEISTNRGTFDAEDEGIYKIAASFECGPTRLALTWEARRRDNRTVKVIMRLEVVRAGTGATP